MTSYTHGAGSGARIARPFCASLSWLLTAASIALSAGCQGGYPIPATLCDEWCDASQVLCAPYNPASCVAGCERQQLPRASCRAEFDVALRCFGVTPKSAFTCDYTPQPPCWMELASLSACVAYDSSSAVDGAPEPAPVPAN